MAAPAAAAPPAAKREKHVHVDAPIDKICVPSIGPQAQSKRDNAPMYSLSKCTRKMREKVFISKEASNSQTSPDTPGAIYEVKSTLNLSTGNLCDILDFQLHTEFISCGYCNA